MLNLEKYQKQQAHWPQQGPHILAPYDDESIIVYQAYRKEIAEYALQHQKFGGEFSFTRMSWIKPNFLWMMYRSGWASKAGQEYVLAIRLRRAFFEEILSQAVHSNFKPEHYASREAWQQQLQSSEARLQWDPDHDPLGAPLPRRAIQLGLRGNMLKRFAQTELLEILNVTELVLNQAQRLNGQLDELLIPAEEVYMPTPSAGKNIGVDSVLA